jgi:hypothetical protein
MMDPLLVVDHAREHPWLPRQDRALTRYVGEFSGRSPQRNIGQGLKALSDKAEARAAATTWRRQARENQPRGGERSRASAGSTLLVRKVIE